MGNLTAARNTQILGAGGVPVKTSYPVTSGSHIFKGSIVAITASTGFAVRAADSALLICVGMALTDADNTTGADGDINVEVEQGVFSWGNPNSITKASVGALGFVNDDNSVKASGNTPLGVIYFVDDTGVWVWTGLSTSTDGTSLTTFEASLASTAHSAGASLVGVEDASSLLTAADVEDALTEIVKKANAALGVPLTVPVVLSTATSGATVAKFVPGVAGKIARLECFASAAATTTATGVTIQCNISGSAVTGGILTLTKTALATLGNRVSGSTVTAANAFTATQEIEVVVVTATTPFTEGSIAILVYMASA